MKYSQELSSIVKIKRSIIENELFILNEKYKTNVKLTGGVISRGYALKDIDIMVVDKNNWNENVIAVAIELNKKFKKKVEFYNWDGEYWDGYPAGHCLSQFEEKRNERIIKRINNFTPP